MSNDMSECVCVCVCVLGTFASYQCGMNLSHHWLVQWIQGNCHCDRQAFENKGCVSHCDLAIYMKKYLKAKRRRIMEAQIFHPHAKLHLIFKNSSSKSNQNPSMYYNYVTNLKFQHKPKYHLSNNPHTKIDLLLLLLLPSWGQNPLSYYTRYNESKHNILALVGNTNKCQYQLLDRNIKSPILLSSSFLILSHQFPNPKP